MPFGLCNAPSTFEWLMESVLLGLQWQTCLAYLDDVVVFARTEEEMLARLDEVFTRLVKAGLKLKPRKCHLFARETEYLGHVVSEAGVTVSPEKVKAIVEWKNEFSNFVNFLIFPVILCLISPCISYFYHKAGHLIFHTSLCEKHFNVNHTLSLHKSQ